MPDQNQAAPRVSDDDDLLGVPIQRYLDQAHSQYPTVYDSRTRQPVTDLSGPPLARAILAGTHTVEADAQIPVISPTGQPGTVPAGNLKLALTKGFSIDDPIAIAARRLIADHPIFGTSVAALGESGEMGIRASQALDQALGISHPNVDYRAQALLAVAKAAHQANPGITEVAHDITTVVPMFTGIGELGGIAAGAEKAIAGEALEAGLPRALGAGTTALEKEGLGAVADGLVTQTPSFGRQVLGAAARHGIEGTLTSAPEAAQQYFNGDPEKAAETLMWGGGLGMLFGAGGRALGLGLEKGASLGEEYAAGKLSQLGENPGEALSGLAAAGAQKAVRAGASALAHTVGAGTLGYMASKGIAERAGIWVKTATENWLEGEGGKTAKGWLKDLAEAPLERGFGEGLAQQAVSNLGQKLAHVPGVLAGIGSEEATNGGLLSAGDAGRISAQAQFLANNPQAMIDATSHIVAPLAHSPASQAVATALQMQMMRAIGYIADQAPKPPTQTPFTRQTWAPNPLELAEMQRKLEVLHDPLSVVKRLADGTLTQDHVDALQALYPKTYDDIQKTVMATAAQPNAPQLSFAQRQKLGILMGIPMDRLQTPSAVQALQAQFQAAQPPEGGGGPAPKAPRGGPHKPGQIKLSYDKMPKLATTADSVEFGSREV